ncbi:MAG: response regulator [Candidatus Omnitrophica bacterium]|nr:response regulator [Candidatus Omnitrophota bacterium]
MIKDLTEKILSFIKGDKNEKQEILLIDHRFQSLEFLKNALCRRYKVLIAQDKEEAISRARLYKPSMIILNCRLHKEATLDLCASFRKFYEIKNVPILIIAQEAETGKIAEFYTHEIDGVLMEPFTRKELLRQIQAAFLDRR